jgi:bifunctional DNA-binding transcriptional regulator/antitoxin component of YhaV-PrlF toxin-antitoxin module
VSVVVGKEGRLVIPKSLREKYGVRTGLRMIIRERVRNLVLIPVVSYENPAEALLGSVKVSEPVEEPRKLAREHVRRKLA